MTGKNIYMCGVGGQGIGVLAEVLIQGCLRAGHKVKGVDTHGLAQRGGIVISHLRLGNNAHTPRIMPGQADLVVGLERLEAYRAICHMMKMGGTAVYYDVEYQPIAVRMGQSDYPTTEQLAEACQERQGRHERVVLEDLPDPRMQNVAVLGRLAGLEVIEGLNAENLSASLTDVLPRYVLEENLAVFDRAMHISAAS